MGASSGRVAALLCTLLVVAGCAGESLPAPEDSELTASAYRSRVDDATGGQFQITVTNTGDAPVTVHTVTLVSPGFAPVDPTAREIELNRGSRIDIPTPFGAAMCDAGVDPLVARIAVTRDGETQTSVDVPLAQPYDIMARIHDEECTADRVFESVDVTLTLSAPPADPKAPLAATLGVRRTTSTEIVRVDEVRGSVLYDVTGAVPSTLDEGLDSIDVPLSITAATCAAHSIADSKKPFVFPVYLAFGDAAPVYARIPVPVEVQQQLIAYQSAACR